jgi:hypothetical protein
MQIRLQLILPSYVFSSFRFFLFVINCFVRLLVVCDDQIVEFWFGSYTFNSQGEQTATLFVGW